jgi:hypothetical protein
LVADVRFVEKVLAEPRMAHSAVQRSERRAKAIATTAESLICTHRELQEALGWALKHVRDLRLVVFGECDDEPSGEAFEKFQACCGVMAAMEKIGAHASTIGRGCARIRNVLERPDPAAFALSSSGDR